MGKLAKDIPEDFKGSLIGVKPADEAGRVMLEEFMGVFRIDLHAGLQDSLFQIVSASFNKSPPFHSFDENIDIFSF